MDCGHDPKGERAVEMGDGKVICVPMVRMTNTYIANGKTDPQTLSPTPSKEST